MIALNKGYGFNASHTLAYSLVALQEMNLAYKYPIIFWDTANLIVDSGAMNLKEEFEINEDEEKIENSSTNYGRIAAAIGKMKERGIKFLPPDINKSEITYIPDVNNESIICGLRGITRVGNQLIKDIIQNRPYASLEDFMKKIKTNKLQMISLIKSGAFDKLYNEPREQIMNYYIELIADKKKRITLQNMQMLITKNLIPDELDFERRVFNFNKYLKKNKKDIYYNLDSIAANFFLENYSEDFLEKLEYVNNEYTGLIKQTTWDSLYKKAMNPVKDWLKKNQEEILNKLNKALYYDVAEKYTDGSISKWEMDSLNFYYHDHELEKLNSQIYRIEDFFKLNDEPEIDRTYSGKDGKEIILYKIQRIAGTVIDKDKNKNTVTLLTKTGVVTVKIWKSQFTVWDKQISQKDEDGIKHVLEKSWFTRGTKLIISGIKKENTFIPKKYKSTEWPLFEKIIELDNKGFIIQSATERTEVD